MGIYNHLLTGRKFIPFLVFARLTNYPSLQLPKSKQCTAFYSKVAIWSFYIFHMKLRAYFQQMFFMQNTFCLIRTVFTVSVLYIYISLLKITSESIFASLLKTFFVLSFVKQIFSKSLHQM